MVSGGRSEVGTREKSQREIPIQAQPPEKEVRRASGRPHRPQRPVPLKLATFCQHSFHLRVCPAVEWH